MSRYYYFAATLPALQFGAAPPLSSAEFLARARVHLAPEDLALLESLSLASPAEGPAYPPSAFLEAYLAWERSVRNELVRLRARRLGRAGEAWVRPAGRDDDAPRAAQASFGAEDPLQGELALERERWSRLEALKCLHFFDLESLLAYRLQLLQLERLALLRSDSGEGRYRETYADILRPAQSSDMTGVPR